jgi:hypothetical protein
VEFDHVLDARAPSVVGRGVDPRGFVVKCLDGHSRGSLSGVDSSRRERIAVVSEKRDRQVRGHGVAAGREFSVRLDDELVGRLVVAPVEFDPRRVALAGVGKRVNRQLVSAVRRVEFQHVPSGSVGLELGNVVPARVVAGNLRG